MDNHIVVGMGQMLVEPGRPDDNLRRAGEMIVDAADQGCDVIVLPECLDLGWTYPEAPILAQPIPGNYTNELIQAAVDHNIYIAAGLTEKFEDKLYNCAVLISPNGEILRKHRKINELSIATHLYSIGDSLAIAPTKFGNVGLNICADNSPSSLALGHSLALMGANIVLSPSAWAVPPDHDPVMDPYGSMWKTAYAELAKQHHMPVVGVSNVGPVRGGAWDGWKCIGCSLAVDADGEVLVQGSYGEAAEELIVVKIKKRSEDDSNDRCRSA